MSSVPPRDRPDRCPGVVALHEAADGGLARVRVPGGRLTARQLVTLGDAAARLGDGALELTSRGNVQLRGLAMGAGADLAAVLSGVGLLPSLPHERVRNVIASPLAGLDGGGFQDVRPWVAELDARLCAEPRLAALSGRFLFTVDDGRGDVTGLMGDVGLVARPGDVALMLGGSPSGIAVPPASAVDVALAAAHAFLDVAAGAWRVTDLPNAPAHITASLRTAYALGAPRWAGGEILEDSDPYGGRLVPRSLGPGVVGQTDGRVAVVVLAPLGRLTGEQVRVVAGVGDVVVTPWRSLVVPDVAVADAERVRDAFRRVGLVTEVGSGWDGVTACAGRPGCGRAVADVRADAAASVHSGRIGRVHWIGCARGCGRPAGPHVEMLATGDGYVTREVG